jgi:hypothetical protein
MLRCFAYDELISRALFRSLIENMRSTTISRAQVLFAQKMTQASGPFLLTSASTVTADHKPLTTALG